MKRSERFPSRYVQAADLKPGGVTVTMNTMRMEEVGQGADKKTKPVLYFKNASKAMVLNATNDETIGNLFGDDDREWNGQKITLYPTTTTFGGKTVPCIRVRAVDGDKGAAAAAEEESEDPAPKPKKSKSKPMPAKDDTDISDDLDDSIPF
jgi:hypothetical protein